ncbi:MAG: hypothetical protein VCC99_04680 [Alphaproteobacteria bacterium]
MLGFGLFISPALAGDDDERSAAALVAAQAAHPEASCVMQEWEVGRADGEVWQVTAYERFLACYRSSQGHDAVGEIGVETEKRRIPSGTRFIADVTCDASGSCTVAWCETDCCYNLDHEKY